MSILGVTIFRFLPLLVILCEFGGSYARCDIDADAFSGVLVDFPARMWVLHHGCGLQ